MVKRWVRNGFCELQCAYDDGDMSDITARRRFLETFGSLAGIGGSLESGYDRLVFTPAELAARSWFHNEADRLGLQVEVDGNTNMWAWWGSDRSSAVGTGSHLDSVVKGGAYDGALGVVSALLAIERLQETYKKPQRPIVVIAFAGEEGARFGLPTLGSRLLTGALKPSDVLGRTDREGGAFGDAMTAAGFDPDSLGADPSRLGSLACFVELHIEQGRGLVHQDAAVGVISGVWPHGRYRFDLTGTPDHAGAASMDSRADPMLVLADLVQLAEGVGNDRVRATIGRVEVSPNSTNTIAGTVSAWLDARGAESDDVFVGVASITAAVAARAKARDVAVTWEQESWSPAVGFDQDLSETIDRVVQSMGHESSPIPTAAGHDAATLGAHIPSGMLHVRNRTGISHSPHERAAVDDCVSGVAALTSVLEELACR